jgi:selenocysteine-specific elongation factor
VTGEPPLTLGTAGHIDHGKTALVGALTGVDTDRLPEERARGISIALGYAQLTLPSGRRLSVVDVPGHERFVRTMVSGATGIDLFLMVVAADDGVMPQTREHAAVLRGLRVSRGVVAVTKADLADPRRAAAEAAELLPGAEVIACSVRSRTGLDELRAALDRVVVELDGRAARPGPPVLHVDRVFTVRGAGTVVTGTLWSGEVARGATLVVQPGGRRVRVRSVHVHDEPVERAAAGQRVAVNLAGVAVREVQRGDVVTDVEHGPHATWLLDLALELSDDEPPAARVHVHHGARDAPARLVALGGPFWQARLERPLLALPGDRVVIRSIAPPDTLGGGTVLDPHPRRHGPSAAVRARLERLLTGAPESDSAEPVGGAPSARRHPPSSQPAVVAPSPPPSARPEPEPLSPAALELEARLLAAGHEPPETAALGDAAAELPTLVAAGRAVRVGRSMHAHPDALAAVRRRVEAIIAAEGSITLAQLRDDLSTSRKYAQALLEHLDAARVTLRLPDDRRVLRRRGGPGP